MRITPAYAGTTLNFHCVFSKIQDHPRLRGNHESAVCIALILLGSPPLTREPPYNQKVKLMATRITPAYAGTTLHNCVRVDHRKDHPRLRGNHYSLPVMV